MKIYAASSWKNAEWHSVVVAELRKHGFEVNDFKDHSSAPSSPEVTYLMHCQTVNSLEELVADFPTLPSTDCGVTLVRISQLPS